MFIFKNGLYLLRVELKIEKCSQNIAKNIIRDKQ